MTPSPPLQRDPFERDRARMNRYRELRDFFDGVQWLGKSRPGETRLVANYARALVRKVVSYTLPDPVGFEVPPPVLPADTTKGTPRERGLHVDDAIAGDPVEAADLVRARQQAGEDQANSVESLLAE